MNKNLVLIGMMGSGKSTIGKEISKKSSLKFKDIDQLVENDQKMKIREIFEKKGENFFRKIGKFNFFNSFKSIFNYYSISV